MTDEVRREPARDKTLKLLASLRRSWGCLPPNCDPLLQT